MHAFEGFFPISTVYLEVFSFKLRAAWSDRLGNYILGAQNHNKHNLQVYILYIKVIISYSFKEKNAGKLKCDFVMFIFFIVADWLNKARVLPHLCCDAILQQDFNPMLFPISVHV